MLKCQWRRIWSGIVLPEAVVVSAGKEMNSVNNRVNHLLDWTTEIRYTIGLKSTQRREKIDFLSSRNRDTEVAHYIWREFREYNYRHFLLNLITSSAHWTVEKSSEARKKIRVENLFGVFHFAVDFVPHMTKKKLSQVIVSVESHPLWYHQSFTSAAAMTKNKSNLILLFDSSIYWIISTIEAKLPSLIQCEKCQNGNLTKAKNVSHQILQFNKV